MANLNSKIKDQLLLIEDMETNRKVEDFKSKYPDVVEWFCGGVFEEYLLQGKGEFTFRRTYREKAWRWNVVLGLPFRDGGGSIVDLEGMLVYLQSQGLVAEYLEGGNYEASFLTVKIKR